MTGIGKIGWTAIAGCVLAAGVLLGAGTHALLDTDDAASAPGPTFVAQTTTAPVEPSPDELFVSMLANTTGQLPVSTVAAQGAVMAEAVCPLAADGRTEFNTILLTAPLRDAGYGAAETRWVQTQPERALLAVKTAYC